MTKLLDLTHPLSQTIPSWDGDCCFRLTIDGDYADCEAPNLFRTQSIHCKAGSGTHIDAPAHCFSGAATVDQLDLKNLVTDCVVIHVKGNVDASYKLMPADIEAFEKEHGTIPANSFVIVHTGWSKHWNDPKAYRNDLQFPSVDEDAAKLLVDRDIAGLGIDTLSPDAGGKDFPVHRVVLGAGKYLVENVANLKDVPATGSRASILPRSSHSQSTARPTTPCMLLYGSTRPLPGNS